MLGDLFRWLSARRRLRRIQAADRCPDCEGRGAVPGDTEPCPNCLGTGTVDR